MQKSAKRISRRIYLDHAAATPIDKVVVKRMREVEVVAWGNASSLHGEGEVAKRVLEDARREIALALGCKASELYFTSGGTEGLNIAIRGVVKASSIKIPHVIVSSIEHPGVLETVKSLIAENKIEASFVSPNDEGIINPESIKKELKDSTVLVCVMHANNEIGTIQPIKKIASIIREFKLVSSKSNPLLLTDTCQSALWEDISPQRLGADMVVADGVKMYGPRGIGVLYVRAGVNIAPNISGGGQEGGLRSGTENVVGGAGLAEAFKLAYKRRKADSASVKKLRDYAINKILKEIPGASLNGSQENRLPNNINMCLSREARPKGNAKWDQDQPDSEFLVIKLDTLGFAVSAASACSTLSLENSSYVIESLGKKGCGSSSLRFTLGRDTTKKDLDLLIKALKTILIRYN